MCFALYFPAKWLVFSALFSHPKWTDGTYRYTISLFPSIRMALTESIFKAELRGEAQRKTVQGHQIGWLVTGCQDPLYLLTDLFLEITHSSLSLELFETVTFSQM